MRTTRTVSISMSPADLKVAERLARATNRSLSGVFREGLKRVASEQYWQRVHAIARPKAQALGIGEHDVPRLVHEKKRRGLRTVTRNLSDQNRRRRQRLHFSVGLRMSAESGFRSDRRPRHNGALHFAHDHAGGGWVLARKVRLSTAPELADFLDSRIVAALHRCDTYHRCNSLRRS